MGSIGLTDTGPVSGFVCLASCNIWCYQADLVQIEDAESLYLQAEYSQNGNVLKVHRSLMPEQDTNLQHDCLQ